MSFLVRVLVFNISVRCHAIPTWMQRCARQVAPISSHIGRQHRFPSVASLQFGTGVDNACLSNSGCVFATMPGGPCRVGSTLFTVSGQLPMMPLSINGFAGVRGWFRCAGVV